VSDGVGDGVGDGPADPVSARAGRFDRVDGCDLCEAARITPWFHEDDVCWIAECEICEVPMVVWRFHGTEPPAEHLEHMHAQLAVVAGQRLTVEHYVDDHYHAHARPQGGFFGRGFLK
jgi:hypothetical protein